MPSHRYDRMGEDVQAPFREELRLSQVLLILLIGLVAIGLFVAAQVQAEKRRRTLSTWAYSHGLEFQALHDSGFGDRYPHFVCLNKGENLNFVRS